MSGAGTATTAEPKPPVGQVQSQQPTTEAPAVAAVAAATTATAPQAQATPVSAASSGKPAAVPSPVAAAVNIGINKPSSSSQAPVPRPSAVPRPATASVAAHHPGAALKASSIPGAAPRAPGPAARGQASLAAQQAAAKAAAASAAAAAAAARANQAKAAAAAAAAVASRHTAREHKPSSKKRSSPPPQVTMATAVTATQSASSKGGENTGRWTAEEHRLFLQGLEQHGKGWKKIASLIKSRTVVQIRTHAQKYFQKLAKARQNGEEGEVSMDGRGPGGPHGLGGHGHGVGNGAPTSGSKRRRASSGTKRRSISGVVASAQREAKKRQQQQVAVAAASSASSSVVATPSSTPPPQAHVPVAPALAPYVSQPLPAPGHLPSQQAQIPGQVPSITTAHGTISGAALEETLFRFLTPVGGETVHQPAPSAASGQSAPGAPQVNDVARKAGANPITLPTATAPQGNSSAADFLGGDISPTGVTDLWIESKDAPAWYATGQDVDALLHEADALDWLADTGDIHETYIPPPSMTMPPPAPPLVSASGRTSEKDMASLCSENTATTAVEGMKRVEPSNGDITKEVMPPIPSSGMLNSSSLNADEPPLKKQKVAVPAASSTASLFASATEAVDAAHPSVDAHLDVFDAHLDEQAFVSALLDNHGESTASFPTIH